MGKFIVCKICGASIQTTQLHKTRDMRKHLRESHPEEWSKVLALETRIKELEKQAQDQWGFVLF